MPANFSGTWVSFKSEGWDAVMDIMKVDRSKLPENPTVTETITQDGDTISVVTTYNQFPDAKKEITIRVGETFTDSIMGKPYECRASWEGDNLVLTGIGSGNGGSTRKIVGNEMEVAIHFGSFEAKTWFKKQ